MGYYVAFVGFTCKVIDPAMAMGVVPHEAVDSAMAVGGLSL